MSAFPFPAKSTHSSQSFSSTIFYKKSSPLIQAHSTLLSLSSFSHWFTRYLSSNEIPMAMFWELEMPCQKRQAGLPSWSTLYLYHTVHHQTDGSPAPEKKNRKNLSWEGSSYTSSLHSLKTYNTHLILASINEINIPTLGDVDTTLDICTPFWNSSRWTSICSFSSFLFSAFLGPLILCYGFITQLQLRANIH